LNLVHRGGFEPP